MLQAPTRLRHRLMSVLWSGFLAAAVLEVLVFALVDPQDLRWFGGDALELSARAVYTLGFFAFWAICSAGCALAVLLCAPAAEINAPDDVLDLRTP